ncbi:MAG: VTT domain-containing protein [Planctomycetota bacterium]|nr:VTT domain-containing protein [Planctomycetota bacterium]
MNASNTDPKYVSTSVARFFAIGTFLAIVFLFFLSYRSQGLAWSLFNLSLSSDQKLVAIRDAFHAWGLLAPIAYLMLVTGEVVIAPIPGTLLYLPGGMLFGGFWGGTLAVAGNTIGAGISCQLMRSLLGTNARERIAQQSFFKQNRDRIERHGIAIIVLLRLNPLTSSDLVSYAAGATKIPLHHVMIGTMIGMAPLCYVQAFMSMTLFEWFPWLIWPFVTMVVIYLGILFWLLWKSTKSVNLRSGSDR